MAHRREEDLVSMEHGVKLLIHLTILSLGLGSQMEGTRLLHVCACVRVCVCACVRACVCVCVRACVRACV